MENPFYRHWFAGFQDGLEQMDDKTRILLLEHCAEACSQSYPRKVYQEAFEKAKDLVSFLEHLKAAFSVFDYVIRDKCPEVEILYASCACDLVVDGYISSPHLCECSRMSLLHHWESVFGPGSVQVTLNASLLKGDPACRLTVRFTLPEKWVPNREKE